MVWKFSGGIPVYQQIKKIMRSAVLAGLYPPGSRIPSVRELAAQARVNPNTVQRALLELEQEKLLVSGGTSGRCVTSDQYVLSDLREQEIRALVTDFADRLRQVGVTSAEAAELLRNIDEQEEL